MNEYAKNMRLAISNKDMIDKHGNIDQAYFNTKKDCFWGDKELKSLEECLLENRLVWDEYYNYDSLKKFVK